MPIPSRAYAMHGASSLRGTPYLPLPLGELKWASTDEPRAQKGHERRGEHERRMEGHVARMGIVLRETRTSRARDILESRGCASSWRNSRHARSGTLGFRHAVRSGCSSFRYVRRRLLSTWRGRTDAEQAASGSDTEKRRGEDPASGLTRRWIWKMSYEGARFAAHAAHLFHTKTTKLTTKLAVDVVDIRVLVSRLSAVLCPHEGSVRYSVLPPKFDCGRRGGYAWTSRNSTSRDFKEPGFCGRPCFANASSLLLSQRVGCAHALASCLPARTPPLVHDCLADLGKRMSAREAASAPLVPLRRTSSMGAHTLPRPACTQTGHGSVASDRWRSRLGREANVQGRNAKDLGALLKMPDGPRCTLVARIPHSLDRAREFATNDGGATK
ncbi:hypothetical protein B0H11DRAFT_2237859 [Mycena galericulata]|nr:hypothetical protein B0H11DRAFT_2237859 [Mycena galericulata]